MIRGRVGLCELARKSNPVVRGGSREERAASGEPNLVGRAAVEMREGEAGKIQG